MPCIIRGSSGRTVDGKDAGSWQARLLLDSVLDSESDAAMDWTALGLTAFERDWDNPDDAIYDTWKALYTPNVN